MAKETYKVRIRDLLQYYMKKEKAGLKFNMSYKCKLRKFHSDGEEEIRVVHFILKNRRLLHLLEF